MRHTPNSWLYLRHPEGFTQELFGCFSASCQIWQANVETTLKVWESLSALQIFTSKPEYEFASPEMSGDRKIVTLPYYSDVTHGTKNLFEDDYPKDLYRFFPNWFLLDLELGRRQVNWMEQILWKRLYPKEKAEQMKKDILFQRSAGGSQL